LKQSLPSDATRQFVEQSRHTIRRILNGEDHRMLFIVGPCSIHNVEEAQEYGRRLKQLAHDVRKTIFVVMRTYFEKPRTTTGWKGMINDPDMDGSFRVQKGLKQARELLIYLNQIGLPCGTEVLDPITPQYLGDLLSWGAVGARTCESQVHRQLVSGLSFPTGFKNGTTGRILSAVDAIVAAQYPHCFMGITDNGAPAVCQTRGNSDCHIILRGGTSSPNYDEHHVCLCETLLRKRQLPLNIIVDCSHGNSGKDYTRQSIVLLDILQQIQHGNESIRGVMLESNLNEGKQAPHRRFQRNGVSVTDACIGFTETQTLLLSAATVYRAKKKAHRQDDGDLNHINDPHNHHEPRLVENVVQDKQ